MSEPTTNPDIQEFVSWVRQLPPDRLQNLVIDAYWKNKLLDTDLERAYRGYKSGIGAPEPLVAQVWNLAGLHAYIAEEADIQGYASLLMKPKLTRELTNRYAIALAQDPTLPRHKLEVQVASGYQSQHNSTQAGPVIHSYGMGLLLSLALSLIGQLLYAWIMDWWHKNHPTSDWNVQAASVTQLLYSLSTAAELELTHA